MARELDNELREFIQQYISSVGQLDVLLLLRAEPDREWTVEEVTERLRTSESAAILHLQELQARGLVLVSQEGQASFRFRPVSDWQRKMVEQLADCYGKYRVAVTSVIHSKPSSALQWFSDSFRLRED